MTIQKLPYGLYSSWERSHQVLDPKLHQHLGTPRWRRLSICIPNAYGVVSVRIFFRRFIALVGGNGSSSLLYALADYHKNEMVNYEESFEWYLNCTL